MVAEKTLREERARETRRRLFDAACELFAQRGYHETTVAEIAARAGVAKGTFFVHFATKDAVVTELVAGQTRAARRARQAALEAGGTPLDALSALVRMLGTHAGQSRLLSRAVIAAGLENVELGGASNALFDEVFELMVGDARAAHAAGLLDPDADPVLLARTLLASYLGAALHFTTALSAPAIDAVLGPLVDANLHGFRTRAVPTKGARHEKEPGHAAARPRAGRRPRRR